MIPFKLNQQQFANRFRGILESFSLDLIAKLRKIIQSPPNTTGIKEANIQLFVDYECELVLSAWLYIDSECLKTSEKSQEIAIFESDFYKKSDFSPEYFSSDFGGLDLMADELRHWFSECWWKAGGWSYPIYTYLNVHDDFGNGDIIQLTEKINEI